MYFVVDLPELLSSSSSNVNLTKGDTTQSISCTFAGLPRPQVSWYHNGQLIKFKDKYRINETGTVSADGYTIVDSQLLFKGMHHDYDWSDLVINVTACWSLLNEYIEPSTALIPQKSQCKASHSE